MDRRGLVLDDPDTGVSFRLGEVGMDLAQQLHQVNPRAAREAMSRPHYGFTFSRSF